MKGKWGLGAVSIPDDFFDIEQFEQRREEAMPIDPMAIEAVSRDAKINS